MAAVDLFISKSPLGQGAANIPYPGVSDIRISPSDAARPAMIAAQGLKDIEAIVKHERDLYVRGATQSALNDIKDYVWGAAFAAKTGPLEASYEEVADATGVSRRRERIPSALETYSTNVDGFIRKVFAGIEDSEVRTALGGLVPGAIRAKNWEVESTHRARTIDFLTGQRLSQADAIGDKLSDAFALDPYTWTPADRDEITQLYIRSQTMFRVMAEDGLMDRADVPAAEEKFGNQLAEDTFRGAIERAFREGGSLNAKDGLALKLFELDQLREALESDDSVQKHAGRISDILGLPEGSIVLNLEPETRIALLAEVEKKKGTAKENYRSDIKFEQSQDDRARIENHRATRQIIMETFRSDPSGRKLSSAERQEKFAAADMVFTGPNATLNQADITSLEATDRISPEFAKTLREWLAKGFEGDQDIRVYYDLDQRIANADASELADLLAEVYSMAARLGLPNVNNLTAQILKRKDPTPSNQAYLRARKLLSRSFGGFIGEWAHDEKIGLIVRSALKEFDKQSLDANGDATQPAANYTIIADSVYDSLGAVTEETFVNEIRPPTADAAFQNLSRTDWGPVFVADEIEEGIYWKATATLDILGDLAGGSHPDDINTVRLLGAGMKKSDEGFIAILKRRRAARATQGSAWKTQMTADELRKLMGIRSGFYLTPHSIRLAREDLDRLMNLRSRVEEPAEPAKSGG